MSENTPVLAVTNLHKSFQSAGRTIDALRGVSLQALAGQVTGLIGPDGAGKTTLIRAAAGLLQPDAGGAEVLGINAMGEPLKVQASVGYMPQRFGLYQELSVAQNLQLYADLQGLPEAERPPLYQDLMRMTGLAPFRQRLAGKLSGGMQQKLGLACTLVSQPRLLLLDEPTVGVDPVSRRELWEIVYRMVAEQGVAVLVSTAYLDEAERCAEVVLLHEGRVLGAGRPETFREGVQGRCFALQPSQMRRRRAQALLAAAPGVRDAVLDGDRVRVLLDTSRPPAAKALPEGLRADRFEPIEARFEDAFVDRLFEQQTPPSAGGDEDSAEAEPAASGASGQAIEVEHLSRRFGDFYAVRRVSFGVERGEVFGLLGANGAGKTTTFRMLCGLLPPSEGRLSVAGHDLRQAAAAARARIGYMSQKFSLYGNLNVGENLEFFASAYGLRRRQRRARIDWALREFELEAHGRSMSMRLPLGYKQRLALACALMHRPEILFLDEPTSGVDPLARREFWRRINRLAEIGVTVLVTTHFMEEAEYCDRLAIMDAGEVLAIDTPGNIRRGAADPDNPAPSMEDAFIAVIRQRQHEAAA